MGEDSSFTDSGYGGHGYGPPGILEQTPILDIHGSAEADDYNTQILEADKSGTTDDMIAVVATANDFEHMGDKDLPWAVDEVMNHDTHCCKGGACGIFGNQGGY